MVRPQNFHPPKSFVLSRFTFRSTGLTNNEITLTFGKERRNELVSNTARTSGRFDCWHFDPGDAKAFELPDRSLPHDNRNTGIDAWLLAPLIAGILILAMPRLPNYIVVIRTFLGRTAIPAVDGLISALS